MCRMKCLEQMLQLQIHEEFVLQTKTWSYLTFGTFHCVRRHRHVSYWCCDSVHRFMTKMIKLFNESGNEYEDLSPNQSMSFARNMLRVVKVTWECTESWIWNLKDSQTRDRLANPYAFYLICFYWYKYMYFIAYTIVYLDRGSKQ